METGGATWRFLRQDYSADMERKPNPLSSYVFQFCTAQHYISATAEVFAHIHICLCFVSGPRSTDVYNGAIFGSSEEFMETKPNQSEYYEYETERIIQYSFSVFHCQDGQL